MQSKKTFLSKKNFLQFSESELFHNLWIRENGDQCGTTQPVNMYLGNDHFNRYLNFLDEIGGYGNVITTWCGLILFIGVASFTIEFNMMHWDFSEAISSIPVVAGIIAFFVKCFLFTYKWTWFKGSKLEDRLIRKVFHKRYMNNGNIYIRRGSEDF